MSSLQKLVNLKFPTSEQYKKLKTLVDEFEKELREQVDTSEFVKRAMEHLNLIKSAYTSALSQACPKLERDNQLVLRFNQFLINTLGSRLYHKAFELGTYDRPKRLYKHKSLQNFLVTGVVAAVLLEKDLYLLDIEAYTYSSMYYMLRSLIPYCDPTIATNAMQLLSRSSDMGKFKNFVIVARKKQAIYAARIELLFKEKEKYILTFLVATLMDYIKANLKAALTPYRKKYYELVQNKEVLEKETRDLTIPATTFPTILSDFLQRIYWSSKAVDNEKERCVLKYFSDHEEETKDIFKQVLIFVSYNVRVSPCTPTWPAEVRRRFRNPKFQKVLQVIDSMIRSALHQCGFSDEAEKVQKYSNYRAHYRSLLFALFFKSVYSVMCESRKLLDPTLANEFVRELIHALKTLEG